MGPGGNNWGDLKAGDYNSLTLKAKGRPQGLLKGVLHHGGATERGPYSAPVKENYWSQRAPCLKGLVPEMSIAGVKNLGGIRVLKRGGLFRSLIFSPLRGWPPPYFWGGQTGVGPAVYKNKGGQLSGAWR